MEAVFGYFYFFDEVGEDHLLLLGAKGADVLMLAYIFIDFLLGDGGGFFNFGFFDSDVETARLPFKIVDGFGEAGARDAVHDGVDAVLDFLVDLALLLNKRIDVAFARADVGLGKVVVDAVDQNPDVALGEEEVLEAGEDEVFDVVSIDRGLFTGLLSESLVAGVVVIGALSRAAVADHLGTAGALDESAQKIDAFGLKGSGDPLVALAHGLYLLKLLSRDDGGDAAVDADDVFLVFVFVAVEFAVHGLITFVPDESAGVFFVPEDVIDRIFAEFRAAFGAKAARVEGGDDLSIAVAAQIHLEDHAHGFGFDGIEDVVLVLVDVVAERGRSARVLALERVLCESFHGLPREVQAIVLVHADDDGLEDDGFGRVVKIFEHGDDGDAAQIELPLVDGVVVAIAGKAVELVDDHVVAGVLRDFAHHLLKGRAVVHGAGDGTVGVCLDQLDVVCLTVGADGAELCVDALGSLLVRGEARVGDGGLSQGCSPPLGCVPPRCDP